MSDSKKQKRQLNYINAKVGHGTTMKLFQLAIPWKI